MSFRALAQSDDDFDSWVKSFQNAQNPNKQPSEYNPEKEYSKGSVVTFPDSALGESSSREYRSLVKSAKDKLRISPKKVGKKPTQMTMKLENNYLLLFSAFSATLSTEQDLAQKGLT